MRVSCIIFYLNIVIHIGAFHRICLNKQVIIDYTKMAWNKDAKNGYVARYVVVSSLLPIETEQYLL